MAGDQRGKNTQTAEAKGSALLCQRLSHRSQHEAFRGRCQKLTTQTKRLGLRAPGDVRFPSGFLALFLFVLQGETYNINQLTACPGYRVSLTFYSFLHLLLTTGAAEILGQKGEKLRGQ